MPPTAKSAVAGVGVESPMLFDETATRVVAEADIDNPSFDSQNRHQVRTRHWQLITVRQHRTNEDIC